MGVNTDRAPRAGASRPGVHPASLPRPRLRICTGGGGAALPLGPRDAATKGGVTCTASSARCVCTGAAEPAPSRGSLEQRLGSPGPPVKSRGRGFTSDTLGTWGRGGPFYTSQELGCKDADSPAPRQSVAWLVDTRRRRLAAGCPGPCREGGAAWVRGMQGRGGRVGLANERTGITERSLPSIPAPPPELRPLPFVEGPVTWP